MWWENTFSCELRCATCQIAHLLDVECASHSRCCRPATTISNTHLDNFHFHIEFCLPEMFSSQSNWIFIGLRYRVRARDDSFRIENALRFAICICCRPGRICRDLYIYSSLLLSVNRPDGLIRSILQFHSYFVIIIDMNLLPVSLLFWRWGSELPLPAN